MNADRRTWWLLLIAVLAAPESKPTLAQTAQQALWTGQAQCQLNIKSDGYVHQEIQTWMMGGQPTQQGAMTVYPGTWSATGEGMTQRAQAAQVVAAKWSSKVPQTSARLAVFVRVSDKRVIIKSWHSPLSVAGALSGVRAVSAGNVSPTLSSLAASAGEWPFPDVEDDATSVHIQGSGTVVVSGNLLPMQTAAANGTANCTWQFSKGAASSPATDATPPLTLNLTSQPVISQQQISNVQQPPISQGMTSNSTSSSQSQTGYAPPSQNQAANASSTQNQTGNASATSSQNQAGSASASQNQTSDGPSMNPPTPTPAPGTIKLQWTAPANTGGVVDSYGIDVDSGGGTTQQTVAAPATTATVTLSPCPYPSATCQAPKTVRFRVRAHSSAGYGPSSDYTDWVRPLTSYAGDNVNSVWTAKQCTTCHTQGSRLNLSGTPHDNYSNIVNANVIATPVSNSLLLACPTGNGPCGTHANHPGGKLFDQTSPEYWLILQWIRDGRQP